MFTLVRSLYLYRWMDWILLRRPLSKRKIRERLSGKMHLPEWSFMWSQNRYFKSVVWYILMEFFNEYTILHKLTYWPIHCRKMNVYCWIQGKKLWTTLWSRKIRHRLCLSMQMWACQLWRLWPHYGKVYLQFWMER